MTAKKSFSKGASGKTPKKTSALKNAVKKVLGGKKKAPARSATATPAVRRATKPAPSASAAKKKGTTAKTAAPKKTVAKKPVAKKTVAKKTASKKAPAKKPAAKKTTAKKSKKTVAKKPVAKKPSPKKSPAKKSPAKKPAAKKPAAGRATRTSSPSAKTTRKPPTASAKSAPAAKAGKASPSAPAKRPVKAAKFDKKELSAIKATLKEELSDLQRRQSELEEDSFEGTQSEMSGEVGIDDDFADAGTATFERERDLSIRNNIRDLIDQMTRAVGRIDEGSYGICERCSRPIDAARLKALPHALLCMDCKRREERAR